MVIFLQFGCSAEQAAIPEALKPSNAVRQWAYQGDISYIADDDGKIGLINRKNEVLLNPRFDYAEPFIEGFARVAQDDEWGFINTAGDLIIQPIWDAAYDFSEGRAMVRQDEKWGLINTTGELIVQPTWENVFVLPDGLFMFMQDDNWGVANTKGETVVQPVWEYIKFHSHESFLVFTEDVFSGFINMNREVLCEIPEEYAD